MKTIKGMQKKGKQIEIEWNMSPKIASKKNSTYKNKRIQPINVEPKYKKLKKKKITSNKKNLCPNTVASAVIETLIHTYATVVQFAEIE